MPSAELWESVKAQAEAWRRSRVISALSDELPANTTGRLSTFSRELALIVAGGQSLFTNPLQWSSRLPMLADVLPGSDFQQLRAAHPVWFDAAQRAEFAHIVSIAWLRSRVPGYPGILGPFLVPDGPHTSREFTDRMVWRLDNESRSLHTRDVPNAISQALGAPPDVGREILAATRAVSSCLQRTPEWAALTESRGTLSSESRKALRDARRAARADLRPDKIDAFEPRLAARRADYREHVLRMAVGTLGGAARSYADALTRLDALITQACSDVFSQLACYSQTTIDATDLEVTPGNPTTIRFHSRDAGGAHFPRLAEVAWINDELVADAVSLTGIQMRFEDTGGLDLEISAELLSGTASTWSRSA